MSGALPPPWVRWGFGRSRGRYRHPSLSSLLFVWRASRCCQLLPTFQVKVFFVVFFWGRKHKINVTTPRCLPLSPGFGCCLEMSPNIVPKCLERLQAVHGSHCSCWSWVGSCTAAPGGAGKQTQSLHQAEHSQPLAFRAGKTHYNHLSCKERNPLSIWGARNPDVDFAEANPSVQRRRDTSLTAQKSRGAATSAPCREPQGQCSPSLLSVLLSGRRAVPRSCSISLRFGSLVLPSHKEIYPNS